MIFIKRDTYYTINFIYAHIHKPTQKHYIQPLLIFSSSHFSHQKLIKCPQLQIIHQYFFTFIHLFVTLKIIILTYTLKSFLHSFSDFHTQFCIYHPSSHSHLFTQLAHRNTTCQNQVEK